MAFDSRITDIARIAAVAAAKNSGTAPQLLMADITFTLADAVEDGRLILGPAKTIEARRAETAGPVHESVVPAGNAPQVSALTPPDDQEGEGDRG